MKFTFWAARNLQKRVCSSTWEAATWQKDKQTTRMWAKEQNHHIYTTHVQSPEVQTHSTLPSNNTYLPSTHISYQQNPAVKRSPNQHPSGTISGGLTQLTLMAESPIPKQNNPPHPATTNPNPNQPTETNIRKTIQGKYHALEETQTSKQRWQKTSTRCGN